MLLLQFRMYDTYKIKAMQGKRPLTDPEIARINETGFQGRYKLRDRAMFTLGWTTGFRCSEIRLLKMHDVYGKKGLLTEITAPAGITKGSAPGNVKKMLEICKGPLKDWINHRDTLSFVPDREEDVQAWRNSYLFSSQKGGDYLSLKQTWKIITTAFTLAGVEGAVSTHSLRKTYAKKAYYNYLARYRDGRTDTEPMRLLQLALGHQDIDTTYRYMSFLSEDIDEEAFQLQL